MASCPTMNPRFQMAFRAWGAITLTLALASGCADETGQFTAAEIDELCLQWCSPGPFSMCGGRDSDCYEDCKHGCNYEAGCEAPGVCTQHLAARNACRLDHMCAGSYCESEAVLYLGCHAKTEFGGPVPPQNPVDRAIVDVSAVGVKLPIAFRTTSRGATHPSVEGRNRCGFTRAS